MPPSARLAPRRRPDARYEPLSRPRKPLENSPGSPQVYTGVAGILGINLLRHNAGRRQGRRGTQREPTLCPFQHSVELCFSSC